jgi:hypothetical protein
MSKQYKVIVNTGKSGDNQVVDIWPGAGRGGQPVRIKAQAGVKYQLQELQRQQQTAPEYVKVKRVGKDLLVVFEGQREADLIIENYYEVMSTPSNNLIGRAENGNFYEYIPEDPRAQGLVPNLREDSLPINVALGGAEVSGAGAAIALGGAAFGGWGWMGGLGASLAAGAVVGAVINNKKTSPSIALSSDTPLATGQSSTVRFTLSEDSTDFNAQDVIVEGGTLSNFQGSGKNYTATFTPNSSNAKVWVDSGKFSNSAGQFNKDGAEANNVLTLGLGSPITDNTPPSIALSADTNTLTNGQSTTIQFSLNEDSSDFSAADVVVSNGVLSNFQGSGKNYSATFTPNSGVTNAEVRVNSEAFRDAAGNTNKDGAESNNAVTFNVSRTIEQGPDNTPPAIIVSSDKGTLNRGQQANITFTLSEASSDFTAADVSVSGGTLSNFQGSGQNYTATFTPLPDSVGQSVIKVDSLRFRDATGNLNNDGSESNNTVTMPTNTVANAVDTVPPTVAITSNKTSLTVGETASITFTLSETSNTFTQGDVQVSGGSLSNFQGSGTSYTATFTANTTSDSSVHVPNSAFSDAAGNWNADAADANNLVTMTGSYFTGADNTPPTVIVSSNKTTLSNTQTATISFTLSEVSTDFTASDVTVIGGTLSNFQGSGTSYTATFTPNSGVTSAAVLVSSDTFRDQANNLNKDGAEANNAVSLTIGSGSNDTTPPTIVVSSDKTSLSGTQTAAISFTLSEASTDFSVSDVTVIGGTLSNFQGSGTTYSATFTPTAGATSGAVVVSTGRFSDAAGNFNQDGTETNNAVSLTISAANTDTTPPTVIVSSDKSTLSNNQTALISFALSEASTDFSLNDVLVLGGSLSNFQGSGTAYTATFTPMAGASSAAVTVASNTFRDAAGNDNVDGAEANNTVSLSIGNVSGDTTPPTIIVTADKTLLSSNQTAAITFTLSEASTDFALADMTVIGGSLSNFQGSGNYYTATFTPTAGATSAAVVVSSGRFSDAAGNFNQDGGETNNAVSLTINSMPSDTTPPTMVVSSDKSTLSSTQTATVSFTLSEASTDFTSSDVTVIGGTLSNFQGSGVNYTATFTPTAGATSAAVVVSSDRFSDAAGNFNKDGAESNNAVSLTINNTPSDTTPPTIIVATDKTTLSNTQTATISFTLSESSTDFTSSDVTVIGGTLSNFQGSGVSYTATFTPTAGATSAAVMVSSDTFRDAAGNVNKDGAESNNAVSLTINNTPSDTTPPTIIVTTDKTLLSSTQTAAITFSLSENSTDFSLADATVIGGTLSNLQGSGNYYTATFTPTAGATSAAVVVSSNRFSDAAGNFNQDGGETNNAVSLTINSTPSDTTPPTIIVSTDKTTLSNTQTATIGFTLSEASTDFTASDVTVIGGSLSNFQGSGVNYTATFTPNAGATSAAVLVSSNAFRDAAGNMNNDGAEPNNAVSLTINNTPTDTTPPTIAISSNKTSLAQGESAVIAFALSESSTDFTVDDVAVAGGSLSNFQGSGANYTATYTPAGNATGAVIRVESNKFSDASANFNQDGDDTNNRITMPVTGASSDNTAPTMLITGNKTALPSNGTATITFTLSEASVDFNAGDVSVAGGVLSNFQGNGTLYTAVVTPTTGAPAVIVSVDSNKFSDAAGNFNQDGADGNNQFFMQVVAASSDTTPPKIAISSSKDSLSTGESALITFTLSESSNDFTVGDVDVAGGALTNFQGSGTSYSATFTPTPDATGGVVYVDSNKFSDASGNLNDDGNDDNNIVMMPVMTQSVQSAALFSFTSVEDPAPPKPVISDDVWQTAANAQVVTFNFDFNKDVIGFDIDDITVANGTKGAFQAISASQYSLQVTMPTGSAAATGTAVVGVLDGSYTDLNNQAGLAAHGTQLFSGNGGELIQGAVGKNNKLQAVIAQLPNGQAGEFYPAASSGLYYTVLADQGPAISDIPVAAPPGSYWQIQSYLDAVRMQDGRVALIWKGLDTITQQASWGYQIMAADGSSTDELVALNDQLGAHTSALSLIALEGGGFAIDQAQLDGTANHTVFTTAQTDLIRVGTSASNTLVGGDGDDQLIAGGGADMVYAGAGNDVVSIDLSNNANLMNANASTRIDGGSGDNQLRLVGAMETTLDLTNPLVGHRLSHFSDFDITGQVAGANTTLANGIQLNVSDVLQYGKSDGWGGHTVQIDGDANDTVTLSNLLDDDSDTGQWDLLGTVDQSGRTYSQYSFSSNQNLQVFIDQQIASQWI